MFAGTADRRQIDAFFRGDPAHRGRGEHLRSDARVGGVQARGFARRPGDDSIRVIAQHFRLAFRPRRRRHRLLGRMAFFGHLDVHQGAAHPGRSARLVVYLGHGTGVPAGYGHGRLVALHLAHVVEFRDHVAHVHEPLFDGHLADALTDVGQHERYGLFAGSSRTVTGDGRKVGGPTAATDVRPQFWFRQTAPGRGAFPVVAGPVTDAGRDGPTRSGRRDYGASRRQHAGR